MASTDLGYAEPQIEPYPEELARRLRKIAKNYRHHAENGYAFNYRKKDGSYSNPNAEERRAMAELLEAVAIEILRLHNKVNNG